MDGQYLGNLVEKIYHKLKPQNVEMSRDVLDLVPTAEFRGLHLPRVTLYSDKSILFKKREIAIGYNGGEDDDIRRLTMRIHGNNDISAQIFSGEEEKELKVLLNDPASVARNPGSKRTHLSFLSPGRVVYSGDNQPFFVDFVLRKKTGRLDKESEALWFMARPIFKVIQDS